ncbi:DoxX family protein (plasmid) [Thalassobaculum sp. OXR-137]|uniref:DoxX family protein n=1 Tax=Thalassobaculum sp. OXR-137 TaxID=3100173 RepID=UPI002AC954AE|nr:DoxX family protein [Thalassobaculum sp. OXR-137]WPZ37209.1 DoxX family protein [Thalassobaculum sp. OXR-137]
MNSTLHDCIARASRAVDLYDRATRSVEDMLEGWLVGLTARLVFASVLLNYYLNSAWTKIGDGSLGVLTPTDSAYVQILPSVMEAHGYDVSTISFLPWGLIVMAGTLAEVVLPILIVLGLFTRVSALGMIVFILVQSWVDITFHGVDAATIGSLFDRDPGAPILDQRLLWLFLLLPLALNGAGRISLDTLVRRAIVRRVHPSAQ